MALNPFPECERRHAKAAPSDALFAGEALKVKQKHGFADG
jgi:hypothetical protein